MTNLRRRPDGYEVRLDGVLIGRVRQTDGEWTAAVWTLQPPSFTARMLEPVEGNFRFRSTAVEAVESAWAEDQEVSR